MLATLGARTLVAETPGNIHCCETTQRSPFWHWDLAPPKSFQAPLLWRLRNEKEKVTMNTTEMQRIIRDCYKQLYANKMNSSEEMDKFLERNNLPRLTLYSWRRSCLSAFTLSKSSFLSINVVEVNSKVQSWTWTSSAISNPWIHCWIPSANIILQFWPRYS